MKKTEFQDELLDILNKKSYYHTWVYRIIKKCLKKGEVLEIGAGNGIMTKILINRGINTYSSDKSDKMIKELEKLNKNVLNLDIENKKQVKKLSKLRKYGNLLCLNVLEHIKDDSKALKNMELLLKRKGTLIIQVPQYRILFNSLDSELKHFRRYEKEEIIEKCAFSNLKLKKIISINSIGIIPWFIYGNILKKKVLKKGYFVGFKISIFLTKIIDKILLNKVGLSMIVILEKK